MNILYLLLDPTQAADHRRGGYATHVSEMVRALEAAGHRVEILDSRPPDLAVGRTRGDGQSIAATRAATRAVRTRGAHLAPGWLRPAGRDLLYLLHNLRAGRLVKARLEQGGVDLVYERFHHLQWAGMRAARRHGVPAILEFNAGVNEAAAFHRAGLGTFARWIEARTLAAADRVITVSGVLRRQVLTLGLPGDRVVAIHNGVNTERFHPGIDGGPMRRRFGFGTRDVVVGFVGSFAPWHGVEVLIEAALGLLPQMPELRFLFVGGHAEEPRFIAARRRVEEAGGRERIVFAGELPFAEVPAAIAAMDIATIPWATDYGSPMKIFEYMAMGRALIAPDLEVLREVLSAGENAVLVRRGDSGELAAAIRRLALDPERRRDLGRAARKDALEHHDWRHHARVVEELAAAIGRSQNGNQRAMRDGARAEESALARARGALLRLLMRSAAVEPRSDDLELGEIFAHPSFDRAPAAARQELLLASARARMEDERAHPFDRYFGRDLAPLLADASVLELGCFTGGRGVTWIERYRLKELVGIDVDPVFVAGAALIARERGARARFVCGLGEALPFANKTFDAILSFDVLEHVQDPERVLGECRRVLRPGGRLFAVFPPYWHPTEHHLGLVTRMPCLHWFFSGRDLVRTYDRLIRERGPAAAWYRRRSPNLASWERGHTLNGITVRRFQRLVARSGFVPVARPALPLFQVGRRIERQPLWRGLAGMFGMLVHVPGIREFVSHRVVAILERPRTRGG